MTCHSDQLTDLLTANEVGVDRTNEAGLETVPSLEDRDFATKCGNSVAQAGKELDGQDGAVTYDGTNGNLL